MFGSMDGIIILLVAVVIILKDKSPVVEEETVMKRETKLNPNFYEDEEAFMEVAHELGFH